jgi:hypothetical protein
MRYGVKVSKQQTLELANIHSELMALDAQVDQDKQLIQSKILKACDLHREAQEILTSSENALKDAESQVSVAQAEFQVAVQEAQMLATKAANMIETLGDKNTDIENNTDGSSFTLLKTGPLRKMLFKKRYSDAKHMTESLNTLLETTVTDHNGQDAEDDNTQDTEENRTGSDFDSTHKSNDLEMEDDDASQPQATKQVRIEVHSYSLSGSPTKGDADVSERLFGNSHASWRNARRYESPLPAETTSVALSLSPAIKQSDTYSTHPTQQLSAGMEKDLTVDTLLVEKFIT